MLEDAAPLDESAPGISRSSPKLPMMIWGSTAGPGVFPHTVRHKNAIEGNLAVRKVNFVAQVGFNYAAMSVLELTLCHAGLCFHTYPRIDLHFSFFFSYPGGEGPGPSRSALAPDT